MSPPYSILCWLALLFSLAVAAPVGEDCSKRSLDAGVDLPMGHVVPASLPGNVLRFTLPFAAPPVGQLRFANPQPIATLPNGYDASKTQASCYQYSTAPRGGNEPSEDCLYMNVFVPKSATQGKPLPILVWLPGGSFIAGSATQDGLDGSKLAAEQNMIVVVAQYRLGLFGWLQTDTMTDEAHGGAPGSSKVAGNQAARDVVAALNLLKTIAPLMGGDAKKITLSGQSSGAHMVRALLTTPAAQPLFSQAILVSDPENYGIATQASQNKLGAYGMQYMECGSGDLACARNKSADDVLYAGYAAFEDVPAQDDSYPQGEPFRPVKGTWIPSAVEDSPRGTGNKKIMLTTVTNEAGNTVGSIFAATAPGAQQLQATTPDGNTTTASLAQSADSIFHHRGDTLAAVPAYSSTGPKDAEQDGLREILEDIATDGLWRCATQKQAINLASLGRQNVYLSQHLVGFQYPSNAATDYCKNRTCHEDDIFEIFGNFPSTPNSAQTAVSNELRARWGAFVRSGSPNAKGYVKWPPLKSASALNIMMIGSDSNGGSQLQQEQRKDVCQGVWGNTVKFDWQLYG